MAFAPLVFGMLLSLLLSVLVAWLTTVSAKPVRAWAAHPWRFFWGSYLLTLLGLVLAALRLPWVAVPLVVCTAIVTVLGAIQGLRVTWRRSRGTSATVVAAGFGMAMVGVVGRLGSAGDWFRFGIDTVVALMGISWWIVLAVVADRLARRFNAKAAGLRAL